MAHFQYLETCIRKKKKRDTKTPCRIYRKKFSDVEVCYLTNLKKACLVYVRIVQVHPTVYHLYPAPLTNKGSINTV